MLLAILSTCTAMRASRILPAEFTEFPGYSGYRLLKILSVIGYTWGIEARNTEYSRVTGLLLAEILSIGGIQGAHCHKS